MVTSDTTATATAPHDRECLDQLVSSYRQQRQPELLAKIVESCEWTVDFVARRNRWHNDNHDDLIQIARLGLMGAIERYDPERAVAFLTFAEATMVGAIRHHHRGALQVKVPRATQELHAACRRAQEQLTTRLQRAPTTEEIAAEVGFGVRLVVDAMSVDHLFSLVSLSWTDDDGPGALSDPRDRYDAALEAAADRSELREALTSLPQRQRTILFLHFYAERTQAEIGTVLGISQVQVSRLMSKALDAMRETCATAD